MRLRTRMIIMFIIMTFMPLILIALAFIGIGLYLTRDIPGGFEKLGQLFSQKFVMDLSCAIFIIMFFTAIILISWINATIISSVKELNIAMQQVAEGNLDYSLGDDSVQAGEFEALYKNYEDMRLRLKEDLRDKLDGEKQHSELISNISHDLKTPITSIKGYVEGILDGIADTPQKREKYLKTIHNQALIMDRLINELTYYASIDKHKIPYNFRRLNIGDYFRDCVEELGMDLEAQDITLNYSNLLDPNTKVIADPEQMKKVINNIVGNSVKYMDKEEKIIDIRILDEEDSIKIEIEDNGKGIATKDLGNIFERFYRTDASRNSTKGGSGIGLSIVKKIIEDHGGYVWASSHEGEGTCLHFVLRKYMEENFDEQNIDS